MARGPRASARRSADGAGIQRRARHRFFVAPGLLNGDAVTLAGPLAHQMARVLRLQTGDRVMLVDGTGNEAIVRLEAVSGQAVSGHMESRRPSRPEPGLRVVLYQALVLREKFEVVLQKGTEVGVSTFVPVWCERSIVSKSDAIDERRLERWRRIVTEAAEQSERGTIPAVEPPLPFQAALTHALASGPTLIAWERERTRSLRAALRDTLPRGSTLSIFVGPEGGFSNLEIDAARDAGAIAASLGPRILRTETAGPVIAALALYEAGDMEPVP
ncbi:MAG: 16S rRNA (uracil(1498)-N(3))-methyltransferase [Chloroflexi bacterium]|nr:16S rRNA (uracil(1498)-N(3))-methyltransferase [Chloroflexota bacterium]